MSKEKQNITGHLREYRDDIKQAIDVMNKGGVILYPTDTIWGIGCDATNEEAVKRVFEIKSAMTPRRSLHWWTLKRR